MDHNFKHLERSFSPIKASNYEAVLEEIHSSDQGVQKRATENGATDTLVTVPKLRRAYSQGSTTQTKSTLNPIENLPDFTYVLDPVGQILYASSAVQTLVGYSVNDVVGHNIMEFIHSEDVEHFVAAFNDSIMMRSDLFHYHRLRRRHGDFVMLETTGHAVYNDLVLAQDLDGNVVPACKFFVLSARGYPTRSMTAFDSLLELRLENEQLKSELRNLSEDDLQFVVDAFAASAVLAEAGGKQARPMLGVRHSISTDGSAERSAFTRTPKSVAQTERHGIKASPKSALKSLENGNTDSRSTTSTNEGLNSPTTSSHRGSLPNSDASNKKNKKVKIVAEQHTCTDCHTTDSPEWRKGPHGPKTLCNACGLRYSKKQKKTELLMQEQMKRRDPSTPGSGPESIYDVDMQPSGSGSTGSITPTEMVRPGMMRAYSHGSAPWTPTSAAVSRAHFDRHVIDSYAQDDQFWQT